MIKQETTTMTSSPYPPPAFLAGYNDVIPGGGNRLLTLLEEQHKKNLEFADAAIGKVKTETEVFKNNSNFEFYLNKTQVFRANFVTICAVILTFLLFVACILFAYVGNNTWAGIFGSGGLITAVGQLSKFMPDFKKDKKNKK